MMLSSFLVQGLRLFITRLSYFLIHGFRFEILCEIGENLQGYN